jgi:mono/diheme cytochrome c family protein
VVGTGTAGTGVSTPSCGPNAIPADVAAVISSSCIACHGSPPVQGVPSSLATYASLTAPATTDKTKSVAAVALARIQPGAAMPMPPPPLTPATAEQVAAFQSWVSAGTPPATCPDGGAPQGTGGIADPYSTPVVCTSKIMWTRGNQGDSTMTPGQACIACHSKGEGPNPPLVLAGTVYPTAHEPDDCNGGAVTRMARVVITGADGQTITMTPNAAGNFMYSGALATPYKAKLTYMGRERAMIAAQTSGDCNSCHTEMGAMMAPGRIMLP